MTIRGISFPFRKTSTSLPGSSTEYDVVRENIERILLTPRGARVMRPDVGADIWSYVFESTGPLLRARIDNEVKRAVAAGEPRARVIRTVIQERDVPQGRKVEVTVIYEVNLNRQQASASFTTPASG